MASNQIERIKFYQDELGAIISEAKKQGVPQILISVSPKKQELTYKVEIPLQKHYFFGSIKQAAKPNSLSRTYRRNFYFSKEEWELEIQNAKDAIVFFAKKVGEGVKLNQGRLEVETLLY